MKREQQAAEIFPGPGGGMPPLARLRLAAAVILAMLAMAVFALYAYELTLATVPRHRAALESLVRSETGLDLRFDELGLRWGWYGPEAVFHRVELENPHTLATLLRAPELVVGIDAWRTLRSGQPEASRIELVSPDIDLVTAGAGADASTGASTGASTSAGSPRDFGPVARAGFVSEMVRLLRGWRGGRIDVQGGTLRLRNPSESGSPLILQIRRASLRREDSDWSLSAFVLLPERLGRTVQIVTRWQGELSDPDHLGGSVHVEAHRLQFASWGSLLGGLKRPARYLPCAGSGDLLLNLDLVRGRIAQGSGKVHAAGLAFGRSDHEGAPDAQDRMWTLGELRGDWNLAPDGAGWVVQVHAVQPRQEVGDDVRLGASFHIDGLAGGGWKVATDDLVLEQDRARLSLSGSIRAGSAFDDPQVDAHGALAGAEISSLKRMLGDSTERAFGAAASHLTAGHVRDAQLDLHGPLGELPFGRHGEVFTGSLIVEGGILSGGGLWPDSNDVDVRIEWRGAHIRAVLGAGHAGRFSLTAAHAEWDATATHPTQLTGHVTGRLEDAIAWLRVHPELYEFVPAAQSLNASGEAAFDFSVSIPPAELVGSRIRARVATTLEDVRLQIAPAAPAFEAVSGAFVYEAGHLHPTTLTGKWLGGPVTLQAHERRERGQQLISIQAAGVANAAQVAELAGAGRLEELAQGASAAAQTQSHDALLQEATWQGSVAWSGALVCSQAAPLASWHMRLDSSLSGLSSKWPEPFTKRPGVAVPLSMEAVGAGDSAQLRVLLGDRLRGAFALHRDDFGSWVLDRGAVRLGAGAAPLPAENLLLIQGHLNRLDLPAYLLAWQALAGEGLPVVHAQIAANAMAVAGRTYPQVNVQADRTLAGTQLRIDSPGLSGTAHWPLLAEAAAPKSPDAALPELSQAGTSGLTESESATLPQSGSAGVTVTASAELHLAHLDLTPQMDATEGLGLVAELAPTIEIQVDDMQWQGKSLGQLGGLLQSSKDRLSVEDIRLAGDRYEASGALRCHLRGPSCRLSVTLASRDVAATLEGFGLRPDVDSADGTLKGDLQWLPPGPGRPWLAGVTGSVSFRIADGAARDSKSAAPGATPFALFAIPALVSGLEAARAQAPNAPLPLESLHFAHLAGDFELHDGLATTSDLDFDGDAEILVRGRTDLLSRDYDDDIQVLRGAERLPAALRNLFATPRMAAAWFSLRELFASGFHPDPRTDLRLQGTWDAPIVMAAN